MTTYKVFLTAVRLHRASLTIRLRIPRDGDRFGLPLQSSEATFRGGIDTHISRGQRRRNNYLQMEAIPRRNLEGPARIS